MEMDVVGVLWRIGATFLLVVLNGFFVAAEFALVKVRQARIASLAEEGVSAARIAQRIFTRFDHYLSACQLGITMASLGLGALGEPAVATLITSIASAAGTQISPDSSWLHILSFAIAFLTITILHMTLGEQAPKIWALHRSEKTTLQTVHVLWFFAKLFGPFIGLINGISNLMLRIAGLRDVSLEESSANAEELHLILATSARAGHISSRQRDIAENVLRLVDLEVRHIVVPRVDVSVLVLARPLEENLAKIDSSRHSRFPVCERDLDDIVGFIHTKDILSALRAGKQVDLRALARPPHFVPESYPLSRLLRELQDAHLHCASVLDERGTCIGLVFLEDAIEEIVGPIHDEFDTESPGFVEVEPGVFDVHGRLPLPEAADRLGFDAHDADEDTIGGYIVSLLKRFPQRGDKVELDRFEVTVERVSRRRIDRLRFTRDRAKGD